MFHFGSPNIGKLSASRDVGGLASATRHQRSDVRLEAVKALGELEDVGAIDPLIAALGDQSPEVRASAAQAVSRLGDAAVAPLIAALHAENPEARDRAAEALAAICVPDVRPPEGLEGAARTTARQLKAWYRRSAIEWWANTGRATATCDDGNEDLEPVDGFLRPGGYLCCEDCTDRLLTATHWDEALTDLQGYFGPGVPEEIMH